MNELTAQDENLLQKLRDQPELTGLFFRKAKSLKWFKRLKEEGHFDPRTLSGPVPVDDQEDRVRIPAWLPLDYLSNTVQKASEKGNEEFASAYLSIIEDVTNYAKEHELQNYQVWWRFASILTAIPTDLIEVKHVWLAEYWLSDRFDRSLVARELGRKWLPKLLDAGDTNSLALADELLALLLRVECGPKSDGRDACSFFFDSYHAKEIIQGSFYQCGEKIGDTALTKIDASLREVLTRLGNDNWSSRWQPAIEDHEQNLYREVTENLLVLSYRQALRGFIDVQQTRATKVLKEMLDSDIDTIVRIAINAVREKPQYFGEIKSNLISKRYLSTNLRHEYWHFLRDVYPTLNVDQKHEVMLLIESITDEDNKRNGGAVAYEKASWLAAIRGFGDEEAAAYAREVEFAGVEPEHPDFTRYMTTRWGGGDSPYSIEELQSFDIAELVERLTGFKPTGGWKEPTVEGLSKAFKDRIKSDPIGIYKNFKVFIDLDLAYIYVLIEAFNDLWNDNILLPWDDIWPQLLEFIELIIDKEEFWSDHNSEQRQEFVANRHWVVGAIGRLVEAGSKSDDHALPIETHSAAKRVIEKILYAQSGENFALDSDAVSIAINSPKGRCLEGVINLALRECRLADKDQNDHTAVWSEYEDLFNRELGRVTHQEYEFVTLVTNYFPSFLYLSGDWLRRNLDQIFDQSDEIGWLCAMQGYSYVGTVYQEIYEHLRDHGDLLKALDHEHLSEKVESRFIQQIVVAYLNDFEVYNTENSLIKVLIERFDSNEIHQMIWFIWTLRGRDNEKFATKVMELRPRIQERIDIDSKEGRKIASDLCLWIEYIDELNTDNMTWLEKIVKFADDAHHGYGVLESLARLSEDQPFFANDLWRSLLERSSSDYPEEAIRTLLTNLLQQGDSGLRAAKETVSIYLRNHNERPWRWLNDIQQTMG